MNSEENAREFHRSGRKTYKAVVFDMDGTILNTIACRVWSAAGYG